MPGSSSRRHRLHAALWLLACLASASPLQAESSPAADPTLAPLPHGARVAILPSETAQARALASSPALRAEAIRAIAAALRKQGYELLPAGEVEATLGPRTPDGCRDAVTCDPELALQVLGVDAVVSIAIWSQVGAPSGAGELLVYVRRKTTYGQAELAVGTGGVAAAATEALSRALQDSLQKHEVRLRIESDPRGATVAVDQAAYGKTPLTVELVPGTHLVTVENPGYVSDSHYVELPMHTESTTLHYVQLAPLVKADGAAATTSQPSAAAPTEATASDEGHAAEGGSHLANYVIAAVLGVAGAALLVDGIVHAANVGDCLRTDADASNQRCVQRKTSGGSTLAIIGGGALLAGGGTLAIVTAVQSSNNTQAMLRFQTTF